MINYCELPKQVGKPRLQGYAENSTLKERQNMPLTKERKGEIALTLVKYKLKREALQLDNIKRRLASASKELGINVKELSEFTEELIRETVDEAFPKINEPPTESPQTSYGDYGRQ